MPGESVGAPERNDAEGCSGMEGDALKDFVDGPIAAARKDDVDACGGCVRGLATCCAWGLGWCDENFQTAAAESVRDLLDNVQAFTWSPA